MAQAAPTAPYRGASHAAPANSFPRISSAIGRCRMASSPYTAASSVNDTRTKRNDVRRNAFPRWEYHCRLYSGYAASISGWKGYRVASIIRRAPPPVQADVGGAGELRPPDSAVVRVKRDDVVIMDMNAGGGPATVAKPTRRNPECRAGCPLDNARFVGPWHRKSTPGGTRTPDARLRTPPLCPTELQGQKRIGGDSGARTRNLGIANAALSQLSYIPTSESGGPVPAVPYTFPS